MVLSFTLGSDPQQFRSGERRERFDLPPLDSSIELRALFDADGHAVARQIGGNRHFSLLLLVVLSTTQH
jgi:hypothetical protein